MLAADGPPLPQGRRAGPGHGEDPEGPGTGQGEGPGQGGAPLQAAGVVLAVQARFREDMRGEKSVKDRYVIHKRLLL